MRVKSAADARRLVKEKRILPMAQLIEAIAGERVKGSWWGHPAGKRIFAIASALEDDETVLAAKMIDGKTAFADSALFAPIYRIVTDTDWRRVQEKTLDKDAVDLSDAVPIRGLLRIDVHAMKLGLSAKALAKPREALERSLLYCAQSVHTEGGHHTTAFRVWSLWASAKTKTAAKKLRFEQAVAEIRAAVPKGRCPLLREI